MSKEDGFVVLRNFGETMRLIANIPALSDKFSNSDLFEFMYRMTGGSIYRKHMVGVILDVISQFVKSGGYPRELDAYLSTKVPLIIGVLVEDPEVAMEAKEFYLGMDAFYQLISPKQEA